MIYKTACAGARDLCPTPVAVVGLWRCHRLLDQSPIDGGAEQSVRSPTGGRKCVLMLALHEAGNIAEPRRVAPASASYPLALA